MMTYALEPARVGSALLPSPSEHAASHASGRRQPSTRAPSPAWALLLGVLLAGCAGEHAGQDASIPTDAGTDAADAGGDPDGGGGDGGTCLFDGTLSVPGQVSGTLSGAGTHANAGCVIFGGTPGPDHTYALHLDAPTTVTLTVTSTANLVLTLREGCGASATHVGCNYGSAVIGMTMRRTLAAGDYEVVVDTRTAGTAATYTLSVAGETPSPHGTCASALRVPPNGTVTGQRVELGQSTQIDCPGPAQESIGPTLWYVTAVPPRSRLQVYAPLQMGAPVSILERGVFEACPPDPCVAGVSSDVPLPLTWDNPTDAPVDVFLSVAATWEDLEPSTFDLVLSTISIAPNAVCEQALPLVPGTPATGDAFVSNLYYTVSVPARSLLRVRKVGSASFVGSAALRLESDCASHTVLDEPPAQFEPVFRNVTDTPREVLVVVAGGPEYLCDGACDPHFEIVAEVSDLSSDAVCEGATPLPQSYTGVLDFDRSGDGLACSVGYTAAWDGTRYFTVHLEAGETLHASLETLHVAPKYSSEGMPMLSIEEGCGGTPTCVLQARSNLHKSVLTYENTTGAAEDVLLSASLVEAMHFASDAVMRTEVRAGPDPHATCATVPEVTSDTTFVGVDLTQGVDVLTAACVPGSTGASLYYPVAVPAGMELYARVDAFSQDTQAFTRLLAGCGATACLDARAATIADGTVQLTHVNESGATEHLVLAVGTLVPTTDAVADVQIALRPPAYALSTIPARCDDLTGASPAAWLPGEPLPFPFTYFGDAVTHYTATSFGYVQLWPSGPGGTQNPVRWDVALPSSDAPEGVIAAFWDAYLGATGTSEVRAAVFGTTPDRRFTVEWSQWTSLIETSSRFTFQAQLFEGSHAVELHYCSLTSPLPALASGGAATIGLQDLSRTRAVHVSSDTPGAVSTGAALRFTPLP